MKAISTIAFVIGAGVLIFDVHSIVQGSFRIGRINDVFDGLTVHISQDPVTFFAYTGALGVLGILAMTYGAGSRD